MKLNINLKPLFPISIIFSECLSFARMFGAIIKRQSKTTTKKDPQNISKNPTPKQTKTICQRKTQFRMMESSFPYLYLMLILLIYSVKSYCVKAVFNMSWKLQVTIEQSQSFGPRFDVLFSHEHLPKRKWHRRWPGCSEPSFTKGSTMKPVQWLGRHSASSLRQRVVSGTEYKALDSCSTEI